MKKTIVLPVGLSSKEEIQDFLRSLRERANLPKIVEVEPDLTEPENRPVITLPGDDWATEQKGMNTHTLRQCVSIRRKLQAAGQLSLF